MWKDFLINVYLKLQSLLMQFYNSNLQQFLNTEVDQP